MANDTHLAKAQTVDGEGTIRGLVPGSSVFPMPVPQEMVVNEPVSIGGGRFRRTVTFVYMWGGGQGEPATATPPPPAAPPPPETGTAGTRGGPASRKRPVKRGVKGG